MTNSKRNTNEKWGDDDITDRPVTRVIIVLVFAAFFGTVLYVIINEFFRLNYDFTHNYFTRRRFTLLLAVL